MILNGTPSSNDEACTLRAHDVGDALEFQAINSEHCKYQALWGNLTLWYIVFFDQMKAGVTGMERDYPHFQAIETSNAMPWTYLLNINPYQEWYFSLATVIISECSTTIGLVEATGMHFIIFGDTVELQWSIYYTIGTACEYTSKFTDDYSLYIWHMIWIQTWWSIQFWLWNYFAPLLEYFEVVVLVQYQTGENVFGIVLLSVSVHQPLQLSIENNWRRHTVQRRGTDELNRKLLRTPA